ncbi:putative glycosyl hydrolase 17 family protein [Lyophyllum shimeji]|uniref:Glycosyl hydrolase 17 family protein n=1 Tax=Lyophyllum shimeji TaxID=47721 RepID=A0A9P3PFM9_LYOSH|nr:putative glycosyl hydrolase 17 family protein [Lyophyllum shimeji]
MHWTELLQQQQQWESRGPPFFLKGAISASIPTIEYVHSNLFEDRFRIQFTTFYAGSEDLKTFRNAYVKYGASRYSGLAIGNEVNDKPSTIMAEVNRARDYLRSAGVSTPVSTAHTWVNIKNNPTLCGTDFVAANAHAFFDGHIAPEGAGTFVAKVVVPALKARVRERTSSSQRPGGRRAD